MSTFSPRFLRTVFMSASVCASLLLTPALGFSGEKQTRIQVTRAHHPVKLVVHESSDSALGGDSTRIADVALRSLPSRHIQIALEDYHTAKVIGHFERPVAGFEELGVVQLADGPAACYGGGPVYLIGRYHGELTKTLVDICNPKPLVLYRRGADLVVHGPSWYNPRIRERVTADTIVVRNRKVHQGR